MSLRCEHRQAGIYKEQLEKMIANGNAYRCFLSPEASKSVPAGRSIDHKVQHVFCYFLLLAIRGVGRDEGRG